MENAGDLVERKRLEKRSKVYRWLFQNYESLAPVLNRMPPPWTAAAEAFRQETGEQTTRQSIRVAWRKVEALKGKRSAGLPLQRLPKKEAKTKPPPPPVRVVREDDAADFILKDAKGNPI
jgi:hypothetical protein